LELSVLCFEAADISYNEAAVSSREAACSVALSAKACDADAI
jgi:hypothetical protein